MSPNARMAVSRRSLVIAALSTVVEWYDFTLYLYLSTVLARVFFGAYETSLLATLGGFAVAYLMRPLGAIAFGHIGDRIGRRSAMLWSMMTMSLAMLATALLPSHAQIGPLAAWLLLALRCIMGFSVGGEYTGVVAYLLESASARHRGLIASCASAASEIGALCAVTVSALTVHLATPAALDAWAWRVPFFVGAGLAGAVWAARASMQESPEFERQREAHSIPAFPLGHALRHHRAGILRGFAISALGSITYYVGITYVPAFLSSSGGRTEAFSLWLATLAALCVILVTPLVGIWSDRIGRKRVLLVFCLAAGVLPMMLFSMMAGSQPLQTLLGALVLAAIAGGKQKAQLWLAVLDKDMLGPTRKFICGDRITLADYVGAELVTLGEVVGCSYADYPNVRRWVGNMKALKSWAKVHEAIDGFAASLKDKQFVAI